MTSAALRQQLLANPAISDTMIAAFLASDEWKMLERKWMPLLPANVYKVILALLLHTRFDVKAWRAQPNVHPSYVRLAQMSGISERTVRRILHRDAQGRFDYTYRGHQLGDLIGMFVLQCDRRKIFKPSKGRTEYTSNAYTVSVILPLPPTEESERLYLNTLTEVRQHRATLARQQQEAAASCDAEREHVRPTWPEPRAANLAAKGPSLKLQKGSDSVRSPQEGEASKHRTAEAIGKATSSPSPIRQDRRSHGEDSAQSASDAHRIASLARAARRLLEQEYDDAADRLVMPTEVLSERELWRIDANAEVGELLEAILTQYRASAPQDGRWVILDTWSQYLPPVGALRGLARLARWIVDNRTGQIDATAAGYYITVARNLVKEARAEAWDLDRVKARRMRQQQAIARKQAGAAQRGYRR